MRQVLWLEMTIPLIFFCLDRINKFCRESLVKTIVSFRKIFLDRFLYLVVKYNPRSFIYNSFS